MTTMNPETPGLQGGVERPRPFIPTPERVSRYLELKTEEVTAQMRSVQGRQELFKQLMEHEEDLRRDHENFHPDALQAQLELAGETLTAHEAYLKNIQSPEKKSLLRRAWDKVKAFPKNHPIVTALLTLAAIAGGIATGFYVTGNWEMMMANTGLSKIIGGAEAASELIPPTPPTAPLPGGGLFEIPPPTSPPDLGIPL